MDKKLKGNIIAYVACYIIRRSGYALHIIKKQSANICISNTLMPSFQTAEQLNKKSLIRHMKCCKTFCWLQQYLYAMAENDNEYEQHDRLIFSQDPAAQMFHVLVQESGDEYDVHTAPICWNRASGIAWVGVAICFGIFAVGLIKYLECYREQIKCI